MIAMSNKVNAKNALNSIYIVNIAVKRAIAYNAKAQSIIQIRINHVNYVMQPYNFVNNVNPRKNASLVCQIIIIYRLIIVNLAQSLILIVLHAKLAHNASLAKIVAFLFQEKVAPIVILP